MILKTNKRLSLAIPTYHRPEVVLNNIRVMLPELVKFSILVYVSDDSTDSKTETVINELKAVHPLIIYRRNDPCLGHDSNLFSTLGMPDTDFVWLLGDSLFVKPGGLEHILNSLTDDLDLCFVNAYVDDPNDRLLVCPADLHKFLLDRTWYLTLSGATIYGRRSRLFINSDFNFSKCRNFPQLGLVLEVLDQLDTKCMWIGKALIEVNKNKKSYWEKSAFKVFVRDWSNLIRSFPQIFPLEEANEVIKSHSRHTGLFGFVSLVYLRSINALNKTLLNEYAKEFMFASAINPIWAKILSFIPVNVCAFVWLTARNSKRLLKLPVFFQKLKDF